MRMMSALSAPYRARLGSRGLIDVVGPDAHAFLQGLLSQECETLEAGDLRAAALLSPQGRLLHDIILHGRDGGVRLDVALSGREALMRRLTLYRLRARVEIAPSSDAVWAEWGGATGAPFQPDPRLSDLGGRAVFGGGLEPVATATEADFRRLRLRLAVLEPEGDGLGDRLYPIEANLDLLNGVDFRKGCFVGQETTSRMKRRGPVRNRVMGFALPDGGSGAAPEPGAEILAGELRAAEVLASEPGWVLALARLDRLDGPLTVNGLAATPVRPAYFPSDA